MGLNRAELVCNSAFVGDCIYINTKAYYSCFAEVLASLVNHSMVNAFRPIKSFSEIGVQTN